MWADDDEQERGGEGEPGEETGDEVTRLRFNYSVAGEWPDAPLRDPPQSPLRPGRIRLMRTNQR